MKKLNFFYIINRYKYIMETYYVTGFKLITYHDKEKQTQIHTKQIGDSSGSIFVEYYKNGKMKLLTYYKDGKVNGKYTLFDENGNVIPDEIVSVRFENDYDYTDEDEEDNN